MARRVPDAARLASRQEQFEALIARHRGIVLKVAHAYCRDPEDRLDLAEEIVAQVRPCRILTRASPTHGCASCIGVIVLTGMVSSGTKPRRDVVFHRSRRYPETPGRLGPIRKRTRLGRRVEPE